MVVARSLVFATCALSSNLNDVVGTMAQRIFYASCLEGVPSLWRELLDRLYRKVTGYVHLIETGVGKCRTEASFSQYVGMGYLETPVL